MSGREDPIPAEERTIFDPRAIRHFSLLPDEDADEAYCVRHDREMQKNPPTVHKDGALYTTAEGFNVYTCPGCIEGLNQQGAGDGEPKAGVKAFKWALVKVFTQWDEGEANGDWFQYVCEGSMEETPDGGKFAVFGGGGDE